MAVIEENIFTEELLSQIAQGYVAAALDGEGCITVDGGGRTRKDGSRVHTASVSVVNSHLGFLRKIRQMAGCGVIYDKPRQSAAHKPIYKLTWNHGQLRWLLPQVVDHLSIKQEQAKLLIEWLNHDEETRRELSETLREMMRTLNERGAKADEAEWVKRGCSIEACSMRAYAHYDLCYRHWLERGEHHRLTCKNCGKEFESPQAGAQFCCGHCVTQYTYEHKTRPERQAEMAEREKHPCPVCGNPVDRTHYARKTYCSEQCQQKATNDRRKKGRDVLEKTCERCGKSFTTVSAESKYCSGNCRGLAYSARKRKGEGIKPRDIDLTCEYCGQAFKATRPDAKYCSLRCQVQRWRSAQEEQPLE